MVLPLLPAPRKILPRYSPISFAAVRTPQPRSASTFGERGDQPGELALKRTDGARELADAAQLVSGDTRRRVLIGTRQAAGHPILPARVNQGARRDLEFRPGSCRPQRRSLIIAVRWRTKALAVIDEHAHGSVRASV